MPLALHDGSLFSGRYQIRRLIAEGGMGAVYEVVQLGTGRRRALKVMHGHILQSAELRERFALEARVAGEIQSEFIVEVIDAGVDHATQMPFLVMELLDGEELGKRLRRVGRFAPEEVVTYLHQTAMALDRTHKASIVHRDLKPENLFLTQRDDGGPRIKILDFGVAKVIAEGATAAGMTRSLGTPLYMPPEQFRAGARLTSTADIYALGMIAYTLLVGEAYWVAETKLAAGELVAFAMLAVRGPVEPPVRRAAARGVMLPARFDAWFAKATAVDPGQRFAKASEAVSALAEVFELTPVRTGPMPSHAEISAVMRAPLRSGSGPALAPAGAAMTGGGAALTPAPAPKRGGRIFGIAALLVGVAAAGLLGTIGGLHWMRSKGATPAAIAAADTAAPAGTEAAAAAAAPTPAPAVSAPAAQVASSSATPSGSTVSPVAPTSIAKPATTASVRPPLPATTAAPTTKRKRPTPD